MHDRLLGIGVTRTNLSRGHIMQKMNHQTHSDLTEHHPSPPIPACTTTSTTAMIQASPCFRGKHGQLVAYISLTLLISNMDILTHSKQFQMIGDKTNVTFPKSNPVIPVLLIMKVRFCQFSSPIRCETGVSSTHQSDLIN